MAIGWADIKAGNGNEHRDAVQDGAGEVPK